MWLGQVGVGVRAMQTMYTATWTAENGWTQGQLQPYGPIQMMPSAQVLNYGQAIFEGMKAQRSTKDRIVLFRSVEEEQLPWEARRLLTGKNTYAVPSCPAGLTRMQSALRQAHTGSACLLFPGTCLCRQSSPLWLPMQIM